MQSKYSEARDLLRQACDMFEQQPSHPNGKVLLEALI
jgi:hypothetical protein